MRISRPPPPTRDSRFMRRFRVNVKFIFSVLDEGPQVSVHESAETRGGRNLAGGIASFPHTGRFPLNRVGRATRRPSVVARAAGTGLSLTKRRTGWINLKKSCSASFFLFSPYIMDAHKNSSLLPFKIILPPCLVRFPSINMLTRYLRINKQDLYKNESNKYLSLCSIHSTLIRFRFECLFHLDIHRNKLHAVLVLFSLKWFNNIIRLKTITEGSPKTPARTVPRNAHFCPRVTFWLDINH